MKEEVYIEQTAMRPAPFAARRVSWGAIFAGLCVTLVIALTLSLLGVAIGAATVDPLQEQNPLRGLALGSGIWFIVTALTSLFVGACVAGRLSGGPRRADGLLHGVVTWSVAELAMVFWLMTAVGALMGGAGRMASSAMSQQGGQASGGTMAAIENQIKQSSPQAGALLPPTGRTEGQTPGQLTAFAQQDPALAAALAKMESQGGASRAPQERDQVISILTQQHGVDQQQANNLVTQWDQQFQQTKGQAEQKTREVGDKAASGIGKAALWGFVGMILGLAVSALGGWIGTGSLSRYRDHDLTTRNVTTTTP